MTQYILEAASWFNFSVIFDYFRDLKRNYDTARKVSATIKELSALTDKELNDIGLSRGMIRSVAMDAYR